MKFQPGQSGNPNGQPTIYTRELGDRICAEIAGGKTLLAVCEEEWAPSRHAVHEWIVANRDGFAPRYHRARVLQAEYLFDETIALADDASRDFVSKKTLHGTERVVDHEHVRRTQLRIDTRWRYIRTVHPGVYGEKVIVEGGDRPVFGQVNYREAAKAIMSVLGRAKIEELVGHANPQPALPGPDRTDAEEANVIGE